MRELRRLACQGIPDGAGIRPVVWKVISVYCMAIPLTLLSIFHIYTDCEAKKLVF